MSRDFLIAITFGHTSSQCKEHPFESLAPSPADGATSGATFCDALGSSQADSNINFD